MPSSTKQGVDPLRYWLVTISETSPGAPDPVRSGPADTETRSVRYGAGTGPPRPWAEALSREVLPRTARPSRQAFVTMILAASARRTSAATKPACIFSMTRARWTCSRSR